MKKIYSIFKISVLGGCVTLIVYGEFVLKLKSPDRVGAERRFWDETKTTRTYKYFRVFKADCQTVVGGNYAGRKKDV